MRTKVQRALEAFDYQQVTRVISANGNIDHDFQTTSDEKKSASAQEYERETTLDLGGLDLSNIGAAEAVAQGISCNKFLTTVHLNQCQISDAGIEKIALALQIHPTIVEVNLSHNKIGNVGVLSLAMAIEKNSKLNSLRLDGNKIGNKGAIKIAYAVVNSKNITCLYLSYNKIGDNGAEMLKRCLKRNNILEKIDLSNNKSINSNILTAISDKLDFNTTSKKAASATSSKIINVEFTPHKSTLMDYLATTPAKKSDLENKESKTPKTELTISSAQSLQDTSISKNSSCCTIS